MNVLALQMKKEKVVLIVVVTMGMEFGVIPFLVFALMEFLLLEFQMATNGVMLHVGVSSFVFFCLFYYVFFWNMY